MILAVHQCHLHINHGVARNEAALKRLAHTFFNAWNILARHYAANDLVLEDEGLFSSCRQRLNLQPNISKLPVPTTLPLVASVRTSLLADRLAVGDARIAYLQINAIFAFDTFDSNLEV